MEPIAHPPETLEGWYALHQIFTVPPSGISDSHERERAVAALRDLACPSGGGWTAVAPLIGSRADVMLIHFRPTLDALGEVEQHLRREPLFRRLGLTYSFLSVTEAGLYHVTAQLAKAASERGGAVGDDAYKSALAERVRAELASPHIQRRLYPQRPDDMPYVCFYPMSKRRQAGQNWYSLSLEERSRLMYAHGLTGRRYAGRIMQVITGAIGLDAWEWGVTLFGRDPLDFKKLVTDMRFDEVSAKYAEFGDFYVGKVVEPESWVASLGIA
jgi:chlorite dismutase